MRLQLRLECREPAPVYQYEPSAWIYRVLREVDASYARFLHD